MPISKIVRRASLAAALILFAPSRSAAQQLPNPYGENIPVEVARKAAAAANAEAKKNGWRVAAAVVDTHGDLVFFERVDGTQYGSNQTSQEKARTSARYKRPTKAIEDAVKAGNLQFLGLPGATALEGGIPIVIADRIVGAIGVSGGTSVQDAQCARAGVEAIGGALAAAPATPAGAAAPAGAAPAAPPKK
jgi:uncharacterized protein GlcG (DUF336 family)